MKRIGALMLAALSAAAQSYNIRTVAGGGPADGVQATDIPISFSGGNSIAVDAAGNLYIAAVQQKRVYRVNPDGTIVTVAGTGDAGLSGDGGPATAANLTFPGSVALDNAGNLYIGDGPRIRKVTGGIITTVASGFGDNSPAQSLAVDRSGNVYIDGIQKIANGVTSLLVSTLADGLAVDSSGAVYAAQASYSRIFKLDAGGNFSVPAGTNLGYAGDGGLATKAEFNNPTGIAIDAAGNLYITDKNNNRVRRVSGGIVTTVAGNGTAGFSGDGGLAVNAQLDHPVATAVDAAGNLYIADGTTGSRSRVRKVSGGIITTIAGNGTQVYTSDGRAATGAVISAQDVALDQPGNLYIADPANSRIWKVSAGAISTFAGTGTPGSSVDGIAATGASLGHPLAVAADSLGNVYIGDSDYARIRKVSAGIITTVATAVTPRSLAVDGAGALYFLDIDHNGIQKLSGANLTTLTQYADLPPSNPPSSRGRVPGGIAVDSSGNIYVGDCTNNVIRKLSGGTLTIVAGTGVPGSSGDGGPASSATLTCPLGIAVDSSGNIFFADNFRLRRISGGIITTIAGDGTAGSFGDGGPALVAEFQGGSGLAIDSTGNIYLADSSRVRLLSQSSLTAVNVVTAPAGLSITVDGATYTAPHVFNWISGDMHSIGVTPTQTVNQARYSFTSWSDGLDVSHSITVPSSASTYTASFATQYLLTTAVLPLGSGLITANPPSSDGYYNSGATVQLTANPNPGSLFANWSGDLTGSANGKSIVMNGPHSVIANFTVAPAEPASSQPASGSGSSSNFTFQFSHPAGWQSLSLVNVLINNFLDGRHACYLAYVISANALVLVDDAGDAGGPFAGSMVLGSSSTIQNSQCAVNLLSATGSGTTFTLALNISFKTPFAGNKIQYLAAQDQLQQSSGWQGLGVWQIPSASAGSIAVGTPTPARATVAAGTAQAFGFAFSDTQGAADIGVANVLINSAIDGREGCYLAYVRSTNTLFLVDDAGDAGGPFAGGMVIDGSPGTMQNGQCMFSGSGSSVVLNGNTLTLTLNLTFKQGFSGSRVVWLAGRDAAGGNNTDWQSVGTLAVH